MARTIEHEILAPDGRALAVINEAEIQEGETVQAFIDRNGWYFHLPTRCFVNGEVIRPDELGTRCILIVDEIRIVSRPGMGGGGGRGGGASGAKSIGAIVAMVALAALAPWAGGALAALLPAGLTLGGTAFSSAIGGAALAGGTWLLGSEPDDSR